jgi:3-dehydroquinate dehydratase/shikimate dehydrogenase
MPESQTTQILARLRLDPNLARSGSETALYGIVGDSVADSRAPQVLNAAFRILGMPAVYIRFSMGDFGRFWEDFTTARVKLGLPFEGLTVVRPHKEAALAIADSASQGASRSGAANLLMREGDGWRAANTSGVVDPLHGCGVDLTGYRAAVVGCGGAGRSIAAELERWGVDVLLVNRGEPRGRYASELLGLPWTPLSKFSPAGYDLIVNATPLAAEAPFNLAGLGARTAIADLVYLPDRATVLVAAARERGLPVVDGRQILLAELGRQFRLLTGHSLPEEAAAIATGDDA